MNQPLSKEDYKEATLKIAGSYLETEKFKENFHIFSLKFPRRANNNLKNVNVAGDYIVESKNCHYCYEATNCEDCKYGFFIKEARDCYDITGYGYGSELLLECVAVGYSQRVIGSCWVEQSNDIEYSFCLSGASSCIGCDGLKYAKHCLLNRRYEKKEYEKIRSHIVEELKQSGSYGHFFPKNLFIFGYNETIAQDNFPLTKEEALSQGFSWQDEIQTTKNKGTISMVDLPDKIDDTKDSVLQEILTCSNCGRNYKVIAQELAFYKHFSVPLPRKCFMCRHRDRIQKRGPIVFYFRKCDKCGEKTSTSYAPDRPEIIYCESCYNSEVV